MQISGRQITIDTPTYFIADIAANHDGDLAKAIDLITAAKESGADAAKFQHFRAQHIVSDRGFKSFGTNLGHQTKWDKSVFEVYKSASLPWSWTEKLASHAAKIGIDFFTSPYDFEAVEHVNQFVPAFKIGSGDITWLEIIDLIASKGKPVILATGASELFEVNKAIEVIKKHGIDYCVMQCNTNYTGSDLNFNFINLRVLVEYSNLFPDAIIGLSDHTPGDVTVMGAVSLGARMIEKHFTLDKKSIGPDHYFSMEPDEWRNMVENTRKLECALGDGFKKIEKNEMETAIVQRRGIRASRDLPKGHKITRDDLQVVRPCAPNQISANKVQDLIGRTLTKSIEFDEELTNQALEM